jgi:hypothetical protein
LNFKAILSFVFRLLLICSKNCKVYAWSTQKVHFGKQHQGKDSALYIFSFSSGVVPARNAHCSPIFSSDAFHLPLGNPSSSNLKTPSNSLHFFLRDEVLLFYICINVEIQEWPSLQKVTVLGLYIEEKSDALYFLWSADI